VRAKKERGGRNRERVSNYSNIINSMPKIIPVRKDMYAYTQHYTYIIYMLYNMCVFLCVHRSMFDKHNLFLFLGSLKPW
jgi:hypothetical protein